MEVRPARFEDAAAIAEVHLRTWQGAYAHVFGEERLAALELAPRRAMWERTLRERLAEVLVAEDGGRLVGWCSVSASRDPGADGEVMGIYVLPEAWGSGAGPALLRAGVEALRGAGNREAVLWVLEDNPRARRFYEREGWRLDGARRTGEHLGVETAELRYRIEL